MSDDSDISTTISSLQDNLEQMRASPVSISEKFATGEKFSSTFSYGMDLVEEAANFLDKAGREEAMQLPQGVKTLYGTESMRLTTRLMQIASWLLLQRALVDGEMTRTQALNEKKNIRLSQLSMRTKSTYWDQMPKEFIDIVDRSLSLQKRLCQLDNELYGKKSEELEVTNPVAEQHDRLQTAFNTKRSA